MNEAIKLAEAFTKLVQEHGWTRRDAYNFVTSTVGAVEALEALERGDQFLVQPYYSEKHRRWINTVVIL